MEYNFFENKDLSIEYLSHLSYSDIKNLCQTNKQYKQLCNNQLFQQIVYRKTNIIIKEDIIILLEEIDSKIEKIMQETFIDLPAWVNKPLFWTERKNTIYEYLIDSIAQNLDDGDSIHPQYLDGYTLLSPLGKELLTESCIEELLESKFINLSKPLIKYLRNYTQDLEDFYDIHQRVKDLLFIN